MTCNQITAPDRPWTVVIRGTSARAWGHFATRAEAVDEAAVMRRWGFDAWVVPPPNLDDDPE
jgi:hypothetical protein